MAGWPNCSDCHLSPRARHFLCTFLGSCQLSEWTVEQNKQRGRQWVPWVPASLTRPGHVAPQGNRVSCETRDVSNSMLPVRRLASLHAWPGTQLSPVAKFRLMLTLVVANGFALFDVFVVVVVTVVTVVRLQAMSVYFTCWQIAVPSGALAVYSTSPAPRLALSLCLSVIRSVLLYICRPTISMCMASE